MDPRFHLGMHRENGGKNKLNQCLLGLARLREGRGKAEPPVTSRTGIGIILSEESPAVNLPVEGLILEILEQPAQGWASLSKGHNQGAKSRHRLK